MAVHGTIGLPISHHDVTAENPADKRPKMYVISLLSSAANFAVYRPAAVALEQEEVDTFLTGAQKAGFTGRWRIDQVPFVGSLAEHSS